MQRVPNMDATRIEARRVLESLRQCVERNRYAVSRSENREENEAFIAHYQLTNERIRNLLLGIRLKDYCHPRRGFKPGDEGIHYYVFGPRAVLVTFEGIEEIVQTYVKVVIHEYLTGEFAVVVSVHWPNEELEYPLEFETED